MTLQLLHFVKISQIKNPMIYLFEISCPIKSPIISLSSFPVRSEIICYRYDNTARRTNFQPVCVCRWLMGRIAFAKLHMRSTGALMHAGRPLAWIFTVSISPPSPRQGGAAAVGLDRGSTPRNEKWPACLTNIWYYTFHRWNRGTSFEFLVRAAFTSK